MGDNKPKIGIDLGNHTLKINHKTLTGKMLQGAYDVPESVSHAEYLAFTRTSIQHFMKGNGFKSASFSFTVPCDGTFGTVKVITLPTLDKKSLDKAMKYEIEDSGLVENMDLYHYKWSRLDEYAEENKIKTIAAVLKKDLIVEISKLKKISWSIESVEFQPVTIGRVISGNAVVVDYGYKNTAVYYYLNGILDDMNFIPSGGSRVEEIIRDVLPDATHEKMEEVRSQTFFYGLDEDIPFKITLREDGLIDPVIDINDLSNLEEGIDKDILMEISLKISQEAKYIADEVKRLIRQFELKNSANVEHVFHTGETFKLHAFIDYMEEDLGITVSPLSVLVHDEEIPFEDEAFVLAYAATMSKKTPYLKELNFVKLIRNNTDAGSILIAVALTAIILHGGIFFINSRYNVRLTEVYNIKTEQDRAVNSVRGDIEDIRLAEDADRSIVMAVEGIGAERKWLAEFLYHLPEITPNGLTLHKITAQDGNIILRGYSNNYSNIGFLAIEMEKIGKITIDYIDKDEDWSESDLASLVIVNTEPDEKLSATNEFTMKIETAFPIRIGGN